MKRISIQRQFKSFSLIALSICSWSSATKGQAVPERHTAPAAARSAQVGQQGPGTSTKHGDAKPDEIRLPQPTDADSYTVLYTGRLLGYYRYPEVQALTNSITCGTP